MNAVNIKNRTNNLGNILHKIKSSIIMHTKNSKPELELSLLSDWWVVAVFKSTSGLLVDYIA